MTFANSLLALAGLPLLAAAGYLLALSLLSRRPAPPPAAVHDPAFIVLVPAHDEERGIGATVKSLAALDYPADLRRIVVVADNCTDGTAAAAEGEGAEVIVRRDPSRAGKGFALQFAIDALLAEDGRRWDALVVVDADTLVSPNLLRAVAGHLSAGDAAVQACYLPRRTGGGPLSVITDVAFTAFHVVRSAARERLGLSCGLRGNGMAFTRELLAEVEHAAFSRTEDLEFGVLLGLRGVRVAYAGDTTVWGEMPERSAAVATQRQRWIGGRVGLARRFVPALAARAVRLRSAMLADLACDLVVPPLSVLALAAAAGLVVSGLLAAAQGRATLALAVWGAGAAALGVHVAHAALAAGQGRALLRAAWVIPGYALGKFGIALRAWRPADERWVRTPRQGEGS